MLGFNFARGNVRKLLVLPIYAIGALVTLAVPRAPMQWVFGSGPGVGEGALELYRLAADRDPSLSLTWLAKDDHDRATATALGIPAVLKSSPRGFWLTVRARVIVVTHGFGDANRFGTRGAFIAQLWHGVPLKLIQLDSPATMRLGIPGEWRLREPLRRFYRRGFKAIGLFPAASELVAARLRTAFGLSEETVVVTGDPRDDVLSRGTAEERRAVARAALAEHIGQLPDRVILYAPTWRDGETDPGAPTAAEWGSIAAYLQASDTVMVVRPHHIGVGDYRAGVDASARIRLLGSDIQTDATPLLPAIDVLVTDYSSIAYDFSLTGGTILFLALDEEAYTNSRGLYEPYREFSGGRGVRSWEALLGQLRRVDDDPEWAALLAGHARTLGERHFAFTDGGNTGRVYAEVLKKLGGNR
ncbi:MAG: glycosyl/glycerophosphate transferase [Microbacteriaceae bacterium]|nr:glycosyl/glycerophosphate transferase [Microbacteriaceae bacterium]